MVRITKVTTAEEPFFCAAAGTMCSRGPNGEMARHSSISDDEKKRRVADLLSNIEFAGYRRDAEGAD